MDDLKRGQIAELERARGRASLEQDQSDQSDHCSNEFVASHRAPVHELEQRQAEALQKAQASYDADSSASVESSTSSLEPPSIFSRPGAIAVIPVDRLSDEELYRRSELLDEEPPVEQAPYIVEAAVVDDEETEALRKTLKEQETKMKQMAKALSKYKGSKVVKAVAVSKSDELMSRREQRALKLLTGQPLSREVSVASLKSRNSSGGSVKASCCVIQ